MAGSGAGDDHPSILPGHAFSANNFVVIIHLPLIHTDNSLMSMLRVTRSAHPPGTLLLELIANYIRLRVTGGLLQFDDSTSMFIFKCLILNKY